MAVCRWLPHKSPSFLFFFLKWKGLILHKSIVGNWQHSKVLLTKQWDPIIGVWWWTSHCHTVMIATNACRSLVLQNWLIVLLFMQCDRFLHLGESDRCKCNACKRVFVDKSKWLWFSIPALVFSVHPSALPLWKTSLHLKKKKIILKQHTSPILLFMLFVDVFRKGFLKKQNWSRPTFHGLEERICTYFVHV